MATACVNTNQSNLDKIENFLNDPAYKEALESSANFNSRLCIERRMRLPFLDSQTGLAQNHSSLLMHKRQRMPGIAPGQIYIYPRHRWRKKRRQYLTMNARAFARAADHMLDGDLDMHSISQVENPALQDTDSKDSQLLLKDEVSKEWFYDGDDMLEMDPYDEPDQDSDLDYEETYNKRANKRRKGTGRGRGGSDSPSTPGRRKGSGRGRKKTSMHNFDPTPGDPDKPFACELCGARYKTRPGLTYHYGHSHKEGASDENSRDSLAQNPTSTSSPQVGVPPVGNTQMPGGAMGIPSGGGLMQTNPTNLLGEPTPNVVPVPPQLQGPPTQGHVYQDSYVSFLNHPAGSPAAGGGRRGRQNVAPPPPSSNVPPSQAPPTLPPNLPAPLQPPLDDPPMPVLVPEKNIEPPPTTTTSSQSATAAAAATATASSSSTIANAPSGDVPPIVKDKAVPSPYCDFCLGDSRENKKTGGSEELVSCSDCGRSGHPSCLQFTANMIISVKKYRWQCIECKCCSVCGTSDNDDQLLFCDDCDRGYHMYCLTPPLNSPPEGSWSCKLCIDEFHK